MTPTVTPTPPVTALVADLAAESAELDAVVTALTESGWDTPTPAPGWTVRHQIAHLAWTDQVTLAAAADPERFAAELAKFTSQDDLVDQAAADGAAMPTPRLLDRWRQGRIALSRLLVGLPPGSRLPWVVSDMSPASMATARLMETWAHGQDVLDALGRPRTPTDRLRHIAHLGVRARGFALTAHDLPAPDTEVRVELTGPIGQRWDYGPPEAAERVTGPALDFCLLITRRRHRADLALRAEGDKADQWLDVAQAFAGPPGAGRTPGQFR